MEIGVDIVLISRFEGKDEHYVKLLLTEEEFAVYSKLSDKKRPVFLATRWAGKEAVFKVTQDSNFLSYSVLNDENGKPYIAGHPELKISISHDGGFVVAEVLKIN